MSDLTSKGTARDAIRAAWVDKFSPSSTEKSKTEAAGNRVGPQGTTHGLSVIQVKSGSDSDVKAKAQQVQIATSETRDIISAASHTIKDTSSSARMFHSVAEDDESRVIHELHYLATLAENISLCDKNEERARLNDHPDLATDWNNAAEALKQLQTYVENSVTSKDYPEIQAILHPLIEQQEKEAALFQSIALYKSNALEATEHCDGIS